MSKQPAFLRRILTMRSTVTTITQMEDALKAEGFSLVGSGLFKRAWSKPYARYVVKVRKGMDRKWNSDSGSSMDYYNSLGVFERNEYLPLLYEDDLIQIQAKVKVCGKTGCWSSHYDGHKNNHTHINGHAVTFDY